MWLANVPMPTLGHLSMLKVVDSYYVKNFGRKVN